MRFVALASLSACGISLLLSFIGCREAAPADQWTLSFELAEDTLAHIPATFHGKNWHLENGGEAIVLMATSDSTWSTPVFDGEVWLQRLADGSYTGHWEDQMRPKLYRVPLEAKISVGAVSGDAVEESRWEVTFGEGEQAYGGTLLVQAGSSGSQLRATILTPTGDYRFLHGKRHVNSGGEGREIWTLQTFDGAHLFWLQAEMIDGQLEAGVFKSGTHYSVVWRADRLPDDRIDAGSTSPDMNAGKIDIQGVNAAGTKVVWSQATAQADVTILEVTGTWCPNCMDAGRSLLKLKRKRPGLEIISLCFERLGDPAQALGRIARFKSNIGATWPHWWTGPASKGAAADSLGFLDQVFSFPTTIFVPRVGTPVVHSGFNGPATGVYYAEQEARFTTIVDSLSVSLSGR
jgi:hypothetical protein